MKRNCGAASRVAGWREKKRRDRVFKPRAGAGVLLLSDPRPRGKDVETVERGADRASLNALVFKRRGDDQKTLIRRVEKRIVVRFAGVGTNNAYRRSRVVRLLIVDVIDEIKRGFFVVHVDHLFRP